MASSSPYATFRADAWMRESIIHPRKMLGRLLRLARIAVQAASWNRPAPLLMFRANCFFSRDRFLLTIDDGHLVQKRDCFVET